MVTKQEVMDHYAQARKDSNCGDCSPFVMAHLSRMVEDENGLYTLISQFFETREYYTLEMVKEGIRADIAQYIKDLQKVAEI
jgi:hypothetical protein